MESITAIIVTIIMIAVNSPGEKHPGIDMKAVRSIEKTEQEV
jgi:hypothetical protein